MVQPVQYQSEDRAISPISYLQRRWAHGGFAITAQLPPLQDVNAGTFVEQIATQVSHFDAVLIDDAPGGRVAVSSLAMAVLLKRAGVETMVQMSGRDRNRLALQGDMLATGALGIHNLLIDTRPPVRTGFRQNSDARLVVDLHGPVLLAAAARMRDEGRFTSGASIKTPPVFYLGALVSLENRLLAEDLSAAQFLVTTPLHVTHHLADKLGSYCMAYTDLLRIRPLLVSLPLVYSAQGEDTRHQEMLEACAQSMIVAVEALKMCEGIRGCNIVLEHFADLAVLERVAQALASPREMQE